MINRILSDMDGVLTNFNAGIMKIYGLKDDPYLDPKNKGKTWTDILGMKKSEFYKPLTYRFWSELEWMPDGKEILKVCEEFSKEVFILSSPVETFGCLDGKRDWIKKNTKYNQKFLIGTPKYLCATPTALLIDDMEKNTSKFINNGGKAFLVSRGWNNEPKIEDIPNFLANWLKQMFVE